MESHKLAAAVLEEAVCASTEKQLHLHCHAVSGKGWVEVGGRRFVGNEYVKAARHLHDQKKLELHNSEANKTVYHLGEHVCSKVSAQ